MVALLKYLKGGGDTGLLSVKAVQRRFCSFLDKPEHYENLSSQEIRDISEFHPVAFESILRVFTGKTKEDRNKILKDHGYDRMHWMIVTKNDPKLKLREKIIERYVAILSKVVGSHDEAKKKIYSVSTKYFYTFGALLSEQLAHQLLDQPTVVGVIPDCFVDVESQTYAGEPFINGTAVPFDPKYHKWHSRGKNKC